MLSFMRVLQRIWQGWRGRGIVWARPPEGIRPLLRTFKDAGVERGFVKSRIGRVNLTLSFSGVIGALLTTAGITRRLGHQYRGYVFLRSSDVKQIQRVQAGFFCGFLGLALLTILWCRSRRLQRHISPLVRELYVVVYFIAGLLAIVFGHPTYAAILCGYDPESVYATVGYPFLSDDASLLLLIDGVMTSVSLAIPIRWFFVLLLNFIAVLLYASVSLVGQQLYWEGNLLSLIPLAFMAFVGAFLNEVRERRDFQRIITEKSLRCTSELQLSHIMTETCIRPGSARSSQSDCSLPSTTAVCKAFDQVGRAPSEHELGLKRVAEVGLAEHWLIPPAELRIKPKIVLGSGSSGVVVSGSFCGISVAVKLVQKPSKIPALCNELKIVRSLRHPHIISCYGACIEPELGILALVLERVNGPTLTAFVEDAMHDHESAQARIEVQMFLTILGVARALRYLHTLQPCIVHGDLKPDNVCVEHCSGCFIAKLLDFGVSRLLTKHARALGGTFRWTAPEVLAGLRARRRAKVCCDDAQGVHHARPTCASDVFSLGRLIFFVSTWQKPLSEMSSEEILDGAAQYLAWPVEEGFRFQMLGRCRQLAESCMQVEMEMRPLMTMVCDTAAAWPRQQPSLASYGYEADSCSWNDGLLALGCHITWQETVPQQQPSGPSSTKAHRRFTRPLLPFLPATMPDRESPMLSSVSICFDSADGGERVTSFTLNFDMGTESDGGLALRQPHLKKWFQSHENADRFVKLVQDHVDHRRDGATGPNYRLSGPLAMNMPGLGQNQDYDILYLVDFVEVEEMTQDSTTGDDKSDVQFPMQVHFHGALQEPGCTMLDLLQSRRGVEVSVQATFDALDSSLRATCCSISCNSDCVSAHGSQDEHLRLSGLAELQQWFCDSTDFDIFRPTVANLLLRQADVAEAWTPTQLLCSAWLLMRLPPHVCAGCGNIFLAGSMTLEWDPQPESAMLLVTMCLETLRQMPSLPPAYASSLPLVRL